jgi:hypothetical protein
MLATQTVHTRPEITSWIRQGQTLTHHPELFGAAVEAGRADERKVKTVTRHLDRLNKPADAELRRRVGSYGAYLCNKTHARTIDTELDHFTSTAAPEKAQQAHDFEMTRQTVTFKALPHGMAQLVLLHDAVALKAIADRYTTAGQQHHKLLVNQARATYLQALAEQTKANTPNGPVGDEGPGRDNPTVDGNPGRGIPVGEPWRANLPSLDNVRADLACQMLLDGTPATEATSQVEAGNQSTGLAARPSTDVVTGVDWANIHPTITATIPLHLIRTNPNGEPDNPNPPGKPPGRPPGQPPGRLPTSPPGQAPTYRAPRGTAVLNSYGPITTSQATRLVEIAGQVRPALVHPLTGRLIALATKTIPVSQLDVLANTTTDNPDPHTTPVAALFALSDQFDPTNPTTWPAEQLANPTYQPGAHLARTVKTRDQVCQHPGCNQPAHRCQLDHIDTYRATRPAQDQTTGSNLQNLCRHHHQLKTDQLIQADRNPTTGQTTWTTKLGHTTTQPQPLPT